MASFSLLEEVPRVPFESLQGHDHLMQLIMDFWNWNLTKARFCREFGWPGGVLSVAAYDVLVFDRFHLWTSERPAMTHQRKQILASMQQEYHDVTNIDLPMPEHVESVMKELHDASMYDLTMPTHVRIQGSRTPPFEECKQRYLVSVDGFLDMVHELIPGVDIVFRKDMFSMEKPTFTSVSFENSVLVTNMFQNSNVNISACWIHLHPRNQKVKKVCACNECIQAFAFMSGDIRQYSNATPLVKGSFSSDPVY
jgi:hypothetical protein